MPRVRLRHRLGPLLGGLLGPPLLRCLGATWRVRTDPPDLSRRVRDEGACVFAVWHGRMLVPAYVLRGCGHAVMISRHADGEVIARIVQRLGFTTVRGSTTRGGAGALHDAVRHVQAGGGAAFTPDGPKGPRERAQPGALFAAARAGVPILPMGVGTASAWTLRSWDGFRIPRPFSRVAVVRGDPLHVPRDLDDGNLPEHRARLEEALRVADEAAEALARA